VDWKGRFVAVSGMTLVVLLALAPAAFDRLPEGQHAPSATLGFSSWKFAVIDGSARVGYDASIALDSSGRAHVSYNDATGDDLKYATNVGGSWVSYALDSSGMVGLSTSIAIDSSDKIHISYLDLTNGDLKYATNLSGTWAYYTVDSSGDVGLFSSIAIDTNDRVHISYLDFANEDLKYATNANGSWACFILDSLGSVGFDTSIAVDSNDHVHISYGDWTNDDLKYATNAGGSWAYFTLDSVGQVGYDTSIALDSNDNVHISYHDETNACLKYATNSGGSWEYFTVDNAGEVGLSTSIAVDSGDNVHIAYRDYSDFSDGDLKYAATNASGSWVTRTLYSTGDVGYDTSIAVGSNGLVHIAFSDYTNDDLKYALGTERDVQALSVKIDVTPMPEQGQWTVQFTANVSGGVEPYTYDWSFGDGGSDHAESPIHTYTEIGTYTATLKVTDSMETSRTDQVTVRVSDEGVTPVIEGGIMSLIMSYGPLIAVILAAIVIAIILARSRRRTAPEVGADVSVAEAPSVPTAPLLGQPAQPLQQERPSDSGGQAPGQAKPALARVEDRLLQLRSMKEKGLISEEEYEEKVKDLIKRW
jgi:hypothetical protein